MRQLVAPASSPAGSSALTQRKTAGKMPALPIPTSTIARSASQRWAAAPIDLGPNNERLEDVNPKVVHAMRELVRQYREEGIVARRNEIRRIRQARLFWQGLQYAWWNPNDMNWHLPYENRSSDDRQLEDMPRYQFVTNFYQGFGLSFVAVLSQDVPSVRFYPQSAQSLQDISAARAASDVATLIEQNNDVEEMLSHIGYFLWTDGKLGAYVRYVADGQRFGFHEENMLEALEIPLGDDVYVCPQCGKETPLGNSKLETKNRAKQQCAAAASSDDIERRVSITRKPNDPSHCSGCGTQIIPAISAAQNVSPCRASSARAACPTARKSSRSPAASSSTRPSGPTRCTNIRTCNGRRKCIARN